MTIIILPIRIPDGKTLPSPDVNTLSPILTSAFSSTNSNKGHGLLSPISRPFWLLRFILTGIAEEISVKNKTLATFCPIPEIRPTSPSIKETCKNNRLGSTTSSQDIGRYEKKKFFYTDNCCRKPYLERFC